jgi:hypothetical protein
VAAQAGEEVSEVAFRIVGDDQDRDASGHIVSEA